MHVNICVNLCIYYFSINNIYSLIIIYNNNYYYLRSNQFAGNDNAKYTYMIHFDLF